MKIKTLLISTFLVTSFSFAQNWDYNEAADTTDSKAVLNYINTTKVDDLLDKKKRIDLSKNLIKVFRIQLYSGSRSGANEALSKFKSKFPNVLVETSYEQPYFKTKVSAYRTKLEAKKALKVYKSAFRSAFIFEEKVSIEKL